MPLSVPVHRDCDGFSRRGLDNVTQRHAGVFGAGDQFVQVGHIALVMFAVVKTHGHDGNDRFEGIFRIGQGRQFQPGGSSRPSESTQSDAQCRTCRKYQKLPAAESGWSCFFM